MSYSYDFPRPAVTVDIVLLYPAENGTRILLIRRKDEPFKDKYALPGGFMEMEETLEEAAFRELSEETGTKIDNLKQFRAYSAIDRDPRGRNISVVYYHILRRKPEKPTPGDDAAAAGWFPLNALPELAFDHIDIISDLRKQLGF
jgi:8-oxo-dGTP diphosphatase